MKKLSPAQRRALEFLSEGKWTAPWWGGKPHVGWPKEMSGKTFDKLRELGFVMILQGERYDRTVYITKDGRVALTSW